MATGAAGMPAGHRRRLADPAGPGVTGIVRPEPHSSVARVQPQPQMPPDVRRGSTIGMPDWERWLAFCARIDGFPRHLSIHTGGMLVTAAPLIDIAPLERATMPGRVVVQFDKRDVETIKLIKLDLLGLGMLAAIDETLQLIEARLRRLRRPRSAAGRRARSLRDAPGGRHGGRLPGREPGPDADAAQVEAGQPGRSGRGGGDHPARPDPGQRRPSVPAPPPGARAGRVPPSQPGAGPARDPRRDPVPGAGHADRHHRGGLQRRASRTASGGRWGRGARAGRWRSCTPVSSTAAARPTASPTSRPRSSSARSRPSPRSASPRATPRPSPEPPTSRPSSSSSTRPSSPRA